jgi:hypothetical protein
MLGNLTRGLRYGLNNLQEEPPDDPNSLFSSDGFTSIEMPGAGEAQVIPAQFRNGPRTWPPGAYPGQGGGLAPGGGPVTEIPMPGWWKKWGPVLPEILLNLHPGLFMDRVLNDPDDSLYSMASRRRPSAAECKKQWAEARDYCAKELARPFPDRYRTGGTDVEECAKGRVSEACGGFETSRGFPNGKDPKKGGNPSSVGDTKKAGNSPKKPLRKGLPEVDPDDVPPIAPE